MELHGVRELQRAFKQVGGGTETNLKAEFFNIARSVAISAQAKVPHRTGRAADSIKPRSTNRGGSIAFGGRAAEYMPWLNFGGRVGRNRSIFRELVKPDRYIYTTISEHREETAKAADQAIERAAKSAGFETHD